MWGNALGWFLSLLLIVATVSAAAWVQYADRPTPATAFAQSALALEPLVPPIPPRWLLPDLEGSADDSSASFSRAIEAYLADRWTYESAARGQIPKDFDSLIAIGPIVDAAMSKGDSLLAPLAEKVVTFKSDRPELEAIAYLGEALVHAALEREESDPAGAVGYYNAALALGAKMCRERLVFQEFSVGLNLMSESSQRLIKLVKNARRLDALKKFDPARIEFFDQHVRPVWQVLGSVDPNVVAQHAGDIALIAKNSKERMWRVEAVFALGRLKFSAPRPRDMFLAKQTLESLSRGEPDAIVRTAATAARDMTIEDFRMLH